MIGLKIRSFPVNHGMPCYGFRFELERKGAFDPERARELRVPVAEWKSLQRGDSVRVGLKRIHPEDVLGAPRKGICFTFSTDTRPCETLCRYTAGTDLLILEGMYASEEKRSLAVKNHHMMFSEAAEIARAAQPVKLILTHFSTSLEAPEEGLPTAREIFPETAAGQDGTLIVLRYPREREKAGIEITRKEDW